MNQAGIADVSLGIAKVVVILILGDGHIAVRIGLILDVLAQTLQFGVELRDKVIGVPIAGHGIIMLNGGECRLGLDALDWLWIGLVGDAKDEISFAIENHHGNNNRT